MGRPKGSKNIAVTRTAEVLKAAIKIVPAFTENQTPTISPEHCDCGHPKERHKENGCQHACKCLKTHQ